MDKINVLINAYAVSPNWGSEPGMGWNWIINLANYCNVFVITEGEWKEEILAAVEKLPQKENIHFFFNPVPEKIRKMCWNQGDWRFYWYYRKWQKQSFKIAQQIISSYKIDIVHQLNMIGFREPGYMVDLKNIPFVWGPVGGMELMPLTYLEGAGIKHKISIRLKNFLNIIQTRFSPRVKYSIYNSSQMIAAVKGVKEQVKKYYKKDIITINETGCYPNPNIKIERKEGEFNILWVGKFDFRKQISLALKIISKLKDIPGIKFHIIGSGTDNEILMYKKLALDLKIDGICKWYGLLPHSQVQEIMRKSDILLFTSIMEGTPHVVLEAINNRLPVVCFDTCGQAESVDEKVGIKIPISDVKKSIYYFENAIRNLYNNKHQLLEMSNNCLKRQEELSWDNKAKQVVSIYEQIMNR